MESNIQEKFDAFRRKENALRRITILIAFIPFAIGSVWIYYSYKKVSMLEERYELIKNNLVAEESNYKDIIFKKQRIEEELMKTYGLPIDSIINSSNKNIIIKNSLNANEAVNKLSNNYLPNKNILVRYYVKTIDEEKIAISLKSLGYSFENKKPEEYLKTYKTNCIWFGKNVTITDIKIVVLTLMRAGIEIKGVMRYKNSETNPKFKSNVIEIGSNRLLELQNKPTLTISQIEVATDFPYDAN